MELNIGYLKAGWINNMSSKATYNTIHHLMRLMFRAWMDMDMRAYKTYARMLQSYAVNEPELFIAAYKTRRGL